MNTNKNWKTTITGILTGSVLIINSLLLPILNGEFISLDWTGIAAGLGAVGLGWFASDKGKNSDNDSGTAETLSSKLADMDYERWTKS